MLHKGLNRDFVSCINLARFKEGTPANALPFSRRGTEHVVVSM